MKTGKTYIISGPSGVGKSTVLTALMERRKNLYFSVSATTRGPRPGEVDGVHYHFLDNDTFQSWIDQDEFLEYAQFTGCSYGTPRKYVDEAMANGQDVILDIEVKGAAQVVAKRPGTVRIFLAPPSWEELERRLTSRGTETPEKIKARLEQARKDAKEAVHYDYFIVNDDLETAINEMDAVLTAGYCRPCEHMDLIDEQ